MLQSYFGKEWKIVTVNTVLYTVKPSKINAWGELATFYYPIWWYREPSIIDTFLESYDFTGKRIILFATSGGSGLGKTAEGMKKLVPGAKVENGRMFNGKVSEADVKAWVQSLNL